MDLFEAKKILTKNGYRLIKEGTGWSPRKAEPYYRSQIDTTEVINAMDGDPISKRWINRTRQAADRTEEETYALEGHRLKTLKNAAKYLESKYGLLCTVCERDGYAGIIVNNTEFVVFHADDKYINSYDPDTDWYGKYTSVDCYSLRDMDISQYKGFLKRGSLDEIGKYLAS